MSPWNSGCGNRTSVNPRFATIVPCVSCATELPTSTASVIIEFTSRCPNGCPADHAASRCSACGFMVSVENRTLSASVIVRPGRCRYRTSELELLVVQPALLDVPRHRGAPVKPSSRAITISCTCVVPSPISRIFESR